MALLVGKFVCAGQTKSIKESRLLCHFDMKRVGRGPTAPGIRPLLKIKTRNPETRRERRKEPRKRRFLGVVSRGEKRGWTMTSAGFFARRYTPKKSSVSPGSFPPFPSCFRISGFDFSRGQIFNCTRYATAKFLRRRHVCALQLHYFIPEKKVVPTYFFGRPFMLVCPPAKNFEIAFMSPWMCSTLCAFSISH